MSFTCPGIRPRLNQLRTLGSRRSAQLANFSRCSRRYQDGDHASPSKTEPSTATKKEQDTSQNGKQDGKQKRNETTGNKRRSGFAIPAFALAAVGLPLGWYVKRRYDEQYGMRLSDPREFANYALVGKDTVSSTCAIFRLRPASNVLIDQDEPNLERAITSVEFKQPQLQIARSYTCLPQQDGQHMDELRFLIRREQKGEVSNFLHRLPIDSEIQARGLHAEYALPKDVKSVAFLVGGTGIAPAMQAADKLDGQADIHILWASRRREDCIGGSNDTAQARQGWSWWSRSSNTANVEQPTKGPETGIVVSMLEKLKQESAAPDKQHPRLSVDYFVDEEGAAIKSQDVKNMLNALSTADNAPRGRRILIVSGPEGFISHWAGPKQWANGREVQGPLQGVLSTLDLSGWDVVKL